MGIYGKGCCCDLRCLDLFVLVYDFLLKRKCSVMHWFYKSYCTFHLLGVEGRFWNKNIFESYIFLAEDTKLWKIECSQIRVGHLLSRAWTLLKVQVCIIRLFMFHAFMTLNIAILIIELLSLNRCAGYCFNVVYYLQWVTEIIWTLQ